MASKTAHADALALPMTAAAMSEIADAINLMSAALAEATGTGEGRAFRTFRTSDILEITGLTDRQVREWRRKNKESLAAYDASAESNGALPQLPLTLAEMHRMMADLGVAPRRPAGSRAMRLGCFNFKGGSTKTSTCYNLAGYFALYGWRTLVIDADPQGSLSTMFGFSPEDVDSEHTLMPALSSVSSQDLFDDIHLSPLPTHVDGLDIVPANLDMIGADFDISAAFIHRAEAAREFYACVDRAIKTVEHRYDIILIDGAPAFSFAALATMWAADGMIIPVPPASPDFKATAAFCAMASSGLENLAARAGVQNRQWAPVIFVHNRVKHRSQSSDVIQNLSKDAFGRHLCDTSIPDTSAIPNALARQMTVWEATPTMVDSRGLRHARQAYAELGSKVVSAIRAAWSAGFAKEDPDLVAAMLEAERLASAAGYEGAAESASEELIHGRA
jgi:chromosome partitioning protein